MTPLSAGLKNDTAVEVLRAVMNYDDPALPALNNADHVTPRAQDARPETWPVWVMGGSRHITFTIKEE